MEVKKASKPMGIGSGASLKRLGCGCLEPVGGTAVCANLDHDDRVWTLHLSYLCLDCFLDGFVALWPIVAYLMDRMYVKTRDC